MLAIFFLIAGLYMVFKKEVKISSKKAIKGPAAQKIGLIFLLPALLSYILQLVPQGLLNTILTYIDLTGYAIAIISIFYFIFFYKPTNKNTAENNNKPNLIKKNWLMVGIITILLITTLSTVYYFFSLLPQHRQENLSNKRSDSAQTDETANVDLQAKCAKQAEKTLNDFKDNSGSAYQNFSQQNHYNLKMNKCFVLISYRFFYALGTDVSNQPTMDEQLFDAYENSNLASGIYYENRTSNDFSNPDSYIGCNIGGQKVTYKEYSNFVNERMDLKK